MKETHTESDKGYVKTKTIMNDDNDPIKWLDDICKFLNKMKPCIVKAEISGNECNITYGDPRYEDRMGNPVHTDRNS